MRPDNITGGSYQPFYDNHSATSTTTSFIEDQDPFDYYVDGTVCLEFVPQMPEEYKLDLSRILTFDPKSAFKSIVCRLRPFLMRTKQMIKDHRHRKVKNRLIADNLPGM